MTKFIIETKASDGSWYPLSETFDSQAQAEKFIVDELPETLEARIGRTE